jgi:hypothetical protein
MKELGVEVIHAHSLATTRRLAVVTLTQDLSERELLRSQVTFFWFWLMLFWNCHSLAGPDGEAGHEREDRIHLAFDGPSSRMAESCCKAEANLGP